MLLHQAVWPVGDNKHRLIGKDGASHTIFPGWAVKPTVIRPLAAAEWTVKEADRPGWWQIASVPALNAGLNQCNLWRNEAMTQAESGDADNRSRASWHAWSESWTEKISSHSAPPVYCNDWLSTKSTKHSVIKIMFLKVFFIQTDNRDMQHLTAHSTNTALLFYAWKIPCITFLMAHCYSLPCFRKFHNALLLTLLPTLMIWNKLPAEEMWDRCRVIRQKWEF